MWWGRQALYLLVAEWRKHYFVLVFIACICWEGVSMIWGFGWIVLIKCLAHSINIYGLICWWIMGIFSPWGRIKIFGLQIFSLVAKVYSFSEFFFWICFEEPKKKKKRKKETFIVLNISSRRVFSCSECEIPNKPHLKKIYPRLK